MDFFFGSDPFEKDSWFSMGSKEHGYFSGGKQI